jgi:hypothetical protein
VIAFVSRPEALPSGLPTMCSAYASPRQGIALLRADAKRNLRYNLRRET